jgi:hypothetical protein
MCDECEEFPVQYVAYFNKAGGKLWRPAQKVATTPWAIDIRPVVPPPYPPPQAGEDRSMYPPPQAGESRVGVAIREVRRFVCDEPSARPSEERGA